MPVMRLAVATYAATALLPRIRNRSENRHKDLHQRGGLRPCPAQYLKATLLAVSQVHLDASVAPQRAV